VKALEQPEPRSVAHAVDFPLTLIVPVYREQDSIGRTLDEIATKVKTPHRTLVVYDTEDDPTVPVVRELMPRHPTVELLRNDLGRGVLNAIKKGFQRAPDGATVVVMADLSDDLAAIDRMYVLVRDRGFDLVCGSRYGRGGRQIGGPPFKGFLSRLAGVSLHALTGLPTRDATNAFRMYRTSFLHAVPIESQGGFELSLELTVKAHVLGYKITEVPTTWRDRTAGVSNFKFRAWLPRYIGWYLFALKHKLEGRRRRS
jgi:hypothetical protein